jgi:DNA-binding winged helix-turn-helix (wHTH) protein
MPRFGPFEIAEGKLLKNGIRVRIQEQPLRILESLLDRPGELVTREELRDRLWQSDTFVDFERSLNAAVAKLRQCLNDSAEQPLYVETIARKGYRFIAPVTGDTVPEVLPAPTSETMPRPRKWSLPLSVGAALVTLGVVVTIAI